MRDSRVQVNGPDLVALDHADLATMSAKIGGPLYFRRPVADDAEFMQRVARDPETRRAQRLPAVEAIRSIEELRDLLSAERQDILIGVERSTEQPVGYATFGDHALESTEAISIGLLFDSAHGGKGYGRQVLGAAIWLAQERIRANEYLTELFVGTAVDNGAVQHIMGQLGYEPEPDTRPYEAPNGETVEPYWYRCGPTAQPPRLTDTDTEACGLRA